MTSIHRTSTTWPGAWLLAGLLLAACQSAPPGARPTVPAAAPADHPQSPELPTGVHLQDVFQVPPELEGRPSVHGEMRYLLYLPYGYYQETDRRWPMIYFLHGSGSSEYDSQFVLSYGLPAVLHLGEQPEDFPFVVVSPQAYPGGDWWSEDRLRILLALLDQMLRSYRIDPDRVYLTGLSMGGYGSWHLATTYPDRFAALVSISGSGYHSLTPPSESMLCRMQDLAVWGIHGALDNISSPTVSERNVVGLKSSCLGQVKWTLYEDLGHFGAFERAYRDPALYSWLLEHSR